MRFLLSKEFKKKLQKSSVKLRSRLDERLLLFLKDTTNPILNDHPLHGDYSGYRSLDVAGDIRLIYRKINQDVALFVRFGTHHELYGN